jgi:predicted Fe-Mo cluster-binding NifX family protein
VFDEARTLLVVDAHLGKQVRRTTCSLQPGYWSRLHTMRDLKVDVLLCGAITRSLAGLLEAAGVRVVSQRNGPADAVVDDYLHSAGLAPGVAGGSS